MQVLVRQFLLGIFCASLVAAAEAARRAPGPIESDRPSFMDSPVVVPPGFLQLELGSSYASCGGQRSLMSGGHTVRLGLTPRFEIRVSNNGLMHTGQISGWAGGAVGVKAVVRHEQRWFPALGFIGAIAEPVGNRTFTTRAWDPTVKLSWSKTVIGGVTAAGNINYSSLTDAFGRYGQSAVSLLAGRSIRGVGVFAEVYTLDQVERNGTRTYYFDTGFTRSLGHDFQIDVYGGRSMGSSRPAWFVAAGIVIRHQGFSSGSIRYLRLLPTRRTRD